VILFGRLALDLKNGVAAAITIFWIVSDPA